MSLYKRKNCSIKLKFHNAERLFKERKINCIKYNYSLDGKILNYDALLRLSDNKDLLHILRKDITEKKEFILEADPMILEQVRSKSAKRK